MIKNRMIRNIISGVVTLLLCEMIFTATDIPIMITMYLIGLTVTGIGIFKGTNKIIGVVINDKKN